MTATVWTPTLAVEINGSEVGYAKSARIGVTLNDLMHRAYINFHTAPTWAQGDEVEIFGGGGYNHLSRFFGTIVGGEYLNTDGSFQVTAYGPLWQLARYYMPSPNGLTLAELIGVSGTDEEIAEEVIEYVGLTNVGTIQGTGVTRGELAPAAFHWRRGINARSHLDTLDAASIGYRMVEEGEDISRRLLSRRPAVSAAKTFTEGVDIFAGARTTKSDLQRWHAWSVTGYNFGAGDGPVNSLFPDPPGTVAIRTFQSEMIEKALTADPGTGLSAEAVRDWLMDEEDHAQVRVSGLTTLRDTAVSIGETHLITAPRLAVNGNFCVVGKNIEIGPTRFTQTFDYEGGA